MPSIEQGSGTVPAIAGRRWSPAGSATAAGERVAVISFYLALMTAECLSLTGADGNTVVEGPFASNRLFLEMLGAATGRPVEAMTSSKTGTSIGAALLAHMKRGVAKADTRVALAPSPAMSAYVLKWRQAAAKG
ncbi:MAG: hypothetical protein V9G20_29880 [Candidatus Promineifilaceae bacterium]